LFEKKEKTAEFKRISLMTPLKPPSYELENPADLIDSA